MQGLSTSWAYVRSGSTAADSIVADLSERFGAIVDPFLAAD